MYERLGKWVRATKYYVDPGCATVGTADFVEEGSRACLARHGYRKDGSFSEWVSADHLSAKRPE